MPPQYATSPEVRLDLNPLPAQRRDGPQFADSCLLDVQVQTLTQGHRHFSTRHSLDPQRKSNVSAINLDNHQQIIDYIECDGTATNISRQEVGFIGESAK